MTGCQGATAGEWELPPLVPGTRDCSTTQPSKSVVAKSRHRLGYQRKPPCAPLQGEVTLANRSFRLEQQHANEDVSIPMFTGASVVATWVEVWRWEGGGQAFALHRCKGNGAG